VARRARTVLIVDDEAPERDALAALVAGWGHEVATAATAEEALAVVETQAPAVVVTDLMLPGMDGLQLLEKTRGGAAPPIVLLVTGHATVESAVEAMRRGAYDYLTKPVEARRLQVLLEKALEQASLSREVALLRDELRRKGAYGRLRGESRAMQEVYRWIDLAASSSAPVLIHGESGTGKELVARTIHERSARRDGPLVAVNCAAIPETLIESELFGHERGAFTGATERRAGCFELSDGGTLFLDEIAEMDVAVQAKLLRVLQEGAFRRVGGRAEVSVDVRIIAATNRVPTEAIAREQLREDLYYRLNVFTLAVPALRDRPEDVLLLARQFVEDVNREDGRDVRGLAPAAAEALERHAWPGNVRELRNVVHRAVVAAGSGLVDLEHLPPEVHATPSRAPGAGPGPVTTIREMERHLIVRALAETSQNKQRAARLLGITQKTLYNKLARYGMR
jgi:DNA-binding NtrC family response regulator